MFKVKLVAQISTRQGDRWWGELLIKLPFAPFQGLFLSLPSDDEYRCGEVYWDAASNEFTVYPDKEYWPGATYTNKEDYDKAVSSLVELGFAP